MEAKSCEAVVPSEALKYQTWFLKVSIHCEGCRKKVKKVLQSIDGVFTTTVDLQQQKVTVTGSVGVETLIRKLVKAGKHAEVWPDNLTAGKNSGKDKQQKKKKKEDGEPGNAENNFSTGNAEEKSNCGRKKGIENGGESKRSEGTEAEKKSGKSEGSSEKKKKKKGESGTAQSRLEVQINLSPTRQQSYIYPETYYYRPVAMVGPSYYVSPLPYMCAPFDHGHELEPYYRFQSPPFQIFSDDNSNACSIM